MTNEEIESVKKSIEDYNSHYPTCMQIKIDDMFCEDEKKRIKNIFEFLQYKDYNRYLRVEYRNKLLMKLSTKMFRLGMITADENIAYHHMFRVFSDWGYLQ